MNNKLIEALEGAITGAGYPLSGPTHPDVGESEGEPRWVALARAAIAQPYDADEGKTQETLGLIHNRIASEGRVRAQAKRIAELEWQLSKALTSLENVLPILCNLIDKEYEAGRSEFPSGNISEVIAAQAIVAKEKAPISPEEVAWTKSPTLAIQQVGRALRPGSLLSTAVTALTNIRNECPGGEIGDPEGDAILSRIFDLAEGALTIIQGKEVSRG